MRIGLMAHIPDQPVMRGVEQIVQGDRQLNHAEACAQMLAPKKLVALAPS
jgi:hypothetical protein